MSLGGAGLGMGAWGFLVWLVVWRDAGWVFCDDPQVETWGLTGGGVDGLGLLV